MTLSLTVSPLSATPWWHSVQRSPPSVTASSRWRYLTASCCWASLAATSTRAAVRAPGQPPTTPPPLHPPALRTSAAATASMRASATRRRHCSRRTRSSPTARWVCSRWASTRTSWATRRASGPVAPPVATGRGVGRRRVRSPRSTGSRCAATASRSGDLGRPSEISDDLQRSLRPSEISTTFRRSWMISKGHEWLTANGFGRPPPIVAVILFSSVCDSKSCNSNFYQQIQHFGGGNLIEAYIFNK